MLPSVIAGLVLVGAATVTLLVAQRLRRQVDRRAVEAWIRSTSENRGDAMQALLDEPATNACASYLLAAHHLRNGRVKQAAREFGVAHHSDYRLESAALLTFACLKAIEGPESDIVEQIVRTWEEMRRPEIGRSADEKALLECLAQTTRDPPPLSPIGRLVWCVVSPDCCREVEQLLAGDGPAWAALLK